MDLNGDNEKDFVETIFTSTIDKILPQVSSTLSILKPGTVHHSGLLPVLKELTEISFHGGVIQKMGGGADKQSICILKGSADVLNRDFSLSKTMLLNQLRFESVDPENLLRYSFFQFQADRAIPELEKQVKLFLLPNRAVYLDCKNVERKPQSFGIEDQDTKFNEFKSLSEGDGNRRPEDANYALDVLCRCLVGRDGAGKKKIMPVPLKKHGDERCGLCSFISD